MVVAACSAVERRETKMALTPPGRPDGTECRVSVKRAGKMEGYGAGTVEWMPRERGGRRTGDDNGEEGEAAVSFHERVEDNARGCTNSHRDEERGPALRE